MISKKQIPEEIKSYFPKFKEKFNVSKFEEFMLNDIYEHDEISKIKLNRNVTKEFVEEMKLYVDQKRNIRYTIKGETRSGKSLVGLRVGDIILELTGKSLKGDIEKVVCGNQIEYRRKLKNAEFGDFYLVDENFFQQSGLGASVEAMQLKDYNAQIAKKNISVIFITPDRFLNVGATLGLSSYGRDDENWLSRFLVYKFKDSYPYLIGFIIIDIGEMFRKYDCFLYKHIGGCNNLNRKKFQDIPPELIKHSKCIKEDYHYDEIDNSCQVCPFFKICNHPLADYEKKKDSWIDKEMKGGLDERTQERFKLSLQIILDLQPQIDLENEVIRLKAKNGKDLKNRVRLIVHKYTNTKMGIMEYDELIEIIKTNCDLMMLKETLKAVKDEDLTNKFKELDNSQILSNDNNI